MLFNSLAFLVFFPVVTTLYFLVPYRHRTGLLLLASCIFYMAFVPQYILILAFTIVVDYCAGIVIGRCTGRWRRIALMGSIAANLGVLATFKYAGFLAENGSALLQAMHAGASFPVIEVLLPIGLSFHTFQAMSYTIEVYRENQPVERNLARFALYVMFYPQLVAGPIERPRNLLPQFHERHDFEYARVASGLLRMAVGMFRKVVVADSLGRYVNPVYDHPYDFPGSVLIVATVLFAFQIYFDFSGYCDIALGAAQVMGFRLTENFRTPYFARSISDFWRRWHISLSSWFRDYVYVPMGGSRVRPALHYRNLVVVFLLSGLWHGANWTFVVWGGLHGCFLVCSHVTRPMRAWVLSRTRLSPESVALRVWQTLATFSLVAFSWIFFRAASLGDAWYIVAHLFSGSPAHAASHTSVGVLTGGLAIRLLLVAAVLAVEWQAGRRKTDVVSVIAGMPVQWRYAIYFFLIYATMFQGAVDSQQFIYFRF